MVLVCPAPCLPSGKFFWKTVHNDQYFVTQQNKTGFFGAPFRILAKKANYMVASAATLEEIEEDRVVVRSHFRRVFGDGKPKVDWQAIVIAFNELHEDEKSRDEVTKDDIAKGKLEWIHTTCDWVAEGSLLRKCVVVGAHGCGKSSLIQALSSAKGDYIPSPEHEETIGVDFKFVTLTCGSVSRLTTLQFWDCAGREEYRTPERAYLFKDGWATFVVFDVCDEASFNECKFHLRDASSFNPDRTRVLIAAKVDDRRGPRLVSRTTAEALAEDNDAHYHEVSSYDRSAVLRLLKAIVNLPS